MNEDNKNVYHSLIVVLQEDVGVLCKCPPAGLSHRCPKGLSQAKREGNLWPQQSFFTAAVTYLPDVVHRLSSVHV